MADREQRGRLRGASGGFAGSLLAESSQASDDDRDEQEEQQVKPLARVRDREAEPRLGEDEVVDEERRDRGPERRPEAVAQAGDHDWDEVDGRGVLQADGRAFEEGDHSRGNAKRRGHNQGPGRERTAGRASELRRIE